MPFGPRATGDADAATARSCHSHSHTTVQAAIRAALGRAEANRPGGSSPQSLWAPHLPSARQTHACLHVCVRAWAACHLGRMPRQTPTQPQPPAGTATAPPPRKGRSQPPWGEQKPIGKQVPARNRSKLPTSPQPCAWGRAGGCAWGWARRCASGRAGGQTCIEIFVAVLAHVHSMDMYGYLRIRIARAFTCMFTRSTPSRLCVRAIWKTRRIFLSWRSSSFGSTVKRGTWPNFKFYGTRLPLTFRCLHGCVYLSQALLSNICPRGKLHCHLYTHR